MEESLLSKSIAGWGNPHTLTGLDFSQAQPGVRMGDALNRQYVRFYKKKIMELYADPASTKINEKTGAATVTKYLSREVEREFVEIITPGDKNTIDEFADASHKNQFFPQYAAFRDGRATPLGLPIDECEFISPAVAVELRYKGCHTLEQLADCSDHLCGIIPNGWELREFARQFVIVKRQNEGDKEVEILKAELQKSHAMMAEMSKRLKALEGDTDKEKLSAKAKKSDVGKEEKGIVLPEGLKTE